MRGLPGLPWLDQISVEMDTQSLHSTPKNKTIKYGAGASVDKIWSKDRCGGMSYVVKKVVVKYCADVARVWS